MKDLGEGFEKDVIKAGFDFFEGKNTDFYGQGGSIPLLNELQTGFPEAQIIAMGVLGPHANEHGPNESLHLEYVEKLICALTHIVASSAKY
jgi:acetylornithine deacetylase/succinyl-diaminopimelate desuccinylase-like protein